MTTDETSQGYTLLRVRVTADDDPSVLPRLLGYFQNLNVTPRRVNVEFGAGALVHLFVDVCGLAEDRVARITGKIGQSASVQNAYWHRLI
jgi:hypothetical protein